MSERLLPAGTGGIVVVDKPRGPSSHQVAAWVGEMLGMAVGQGGTLDPNVSGVLVVMVGSAVRLAPALLAHEKEYIVVMRLHHDSTAEAVGRVAAEFSGRIYQRPPRRSAVKRALRIRTIHEIAVIEVAGRLVLMRVRCDAGTYIRSLCRDMGWALGTGAHMQELRRTRSGPFTEKDAISLHDLRDGVVAARNGDPAPLLGLVLSPGAGAAGLPSVVVKDGAVDALCHGAVLAGAGVIERSPCREGDMVAVYAKDGRLVCLGRALVASAAYEPGQHGLVVAPRAVFMPPGTYPRGWKKHERNAGA